MVLSIKKECPVLPLKEMVIFPESTVMFIINDKNSILTVEKAYLNGEKIFCVAQRSRNTNEIKNKDELFDIGTLCEISQKVNMQNGELRLLVKGLEKCRLESIFHTENNSIRCLIKTIRATKIKDDKNELEMTKKIVLKL